MYLYPMSVLTNPFAPHPERIPTETSGDLWGMRSQFAVGGSTVEVETSHWLGTEVYRVDGAEVRRVRNLGWHSRQALEVDGHTLEVSGRWYPFMPVIVTVDGRKYIDDLFPQLRLPLAVLTAVVMPLFLVLAASIAWDLWRLAGL